jgi:small-conductance mechanosensitive channel
VTTFLVGLAIAIGGLVLASILAPIVRKLLGSSKRPEALQSVAGPAGMFVFWTLIAVGLIAAVAQASPETIKPIPAKLIAYMPKALVAGVLLIIGNVVGQLLGLAVGRTVLKATGKRGGVVEKLVQTSVIALFGLMAVGQLGINTTIVNMLVGALLFALSLGSALLIGLGGRDMARNLTAGRYLRALLAPGAVVQSADVSGVVVALRPASIELQLDDGTLLHVPNGAVLTTNLRVIAPAPTPE